MYDNGIATDKRNNVAVIMTAIRHGALAFFAFVAASPSCCLTAQTRQVVTVTDHRPLWGALDQMEAFLGSPINLEEPPYENDADLEAVTDPRVRKEIQGRPVRIPRKGTVSVEFGSFSSAADKILCLNDLLASHRRGNLPGEYRVEEANGAFYVVGVGTRGVNGRQRAVASPMLTPINVPYAKRRLFEVVALITDQISKAKGLQIAVGTIPNGLAEVTFGAQGETGRDALVKLFKEASPTVQVSYRLLADTVEPNAYMLNLRVAGPLDVGPRRPATGVPEPSSASKWLDPVHP